jgi:predicted DNA-binding transcriptional regulator AlpA
MAIGTTRAIPLKEVAAMFCVSTQTLRKWVRLGKFPKPLGVSTHVLVWSPADVERALLGQFKGGKGKR